MGIKPTSVVMALSGGVDSAVAAATLSMAGWEVYGLHFLLSGSQSGTEMKTDAVKRVGEHLDIPIEVLDLRKTFRRFVIDPFIDDYLKGLTPNPCVVCNQMIKFEYLIEYAKKNEIDYIATGHYARVRKISGSHYFELLRGKDRRKGQSYFLNRLNQFCLSRAIFPLGETTKEKVRKQAINLDLPVNTISESQEICFIPEHDYRPFVERKRGPDVNKPGKIVNDHGEILGEHSGTFRYTIGQRQGLGIASTHPYYVKEIKPETDEVVVGRKNVLYSDRVEAEGFNWIGEVPLQKVVDSQAQIRYRHRPAPGHLEVISSDKVRFIFNDPQWAVTPGQALVCYEGERVLGGGWIKRTGNVEGGIRDL